MKRKETHSIFSILKNPISLMLMLGFSMIFFDLQYLLMSRLPGTENEMCVLGAGLNASNITFAILISLMGGLFVAGFFRTITIKETSFKALSFSGIGAFFGMMTLFCTACTIPVISLFGLAIGISFFTTYDIWFKVISLILVIAGLYQINKQLRGDCDRCVD